MKKSLLNNIALAIILSATSTVALADNVYDRSAVGDITVKGGASRIHGDMYKMYDEQIKIANKKKAKNVILLIGDGMGDSEITAARNFAHGAGGAFKGLDALPITGQYTHYSLNKDTKKPVYVTDSAASATAWSIGTKTYNGAIPDFDSSYYTKRSLTI